MSDRDAASPHEAAAGDRRAGVEAGTWTPLRGRTSAVLALFWLAFGIAAAVPTAIYQLSLGTHSWSRTLVTFLAWQVWTPLSLLVLWLARRVPPQWPATWRVVAAHAGGLGFCVLADLGALATLQWGAAQLEGSPKGLAGLAIQGLAGGGAAFDLLIYGALVAVSLAVEYYRRYRDRALDAAQLEARLMEAQLQVLKMQLNPHFLFNTLHSISALMHRDLEAADRMISVLSDLLRLSLENAGKQEIPLKQELDFLERYLEIETTRFSDRLTVNLDIEPQALDARVPNLILQPLVENAIRHGIALRSAPGQVDVMARVANGRLRLEVRDNGPGLSAKPREGIGLSNTRARLAQLYGKDQQLEVRNAPLGGLVVRMTIPLSIEPSAFLGDGEVVLEEVSEPAFPPSTFPNLGTKEPAYARPGRR